MNTWEILPQNVLYIIIGIFVFIWIYTILRVAKDISWRTKNFGLQLISILMILFLTPILWLPLYYLIRPLSREDDELNAELVWWVICYHCHKINNEEFEYCVFCGEKLKIACPHCQKPIGVDYEYCPRCGKSTKDKVEEEEEIIK